MTVALWLMAIQGVIGAFDTLYFHEYRARLPARVPGTARELTIHAVRDFFYAIIFGTLPWFAYHGVWLLVIGAILAIEICLTMADFVEERRARKPLGDVFPGERVTHAIMGIIYGAMLANAIPDMATWWSEPSGLVVSPVDAPVWLRWALLAMAVGVFSSGVRDLYAARGLPGGAWPWPKEAQM